MHRLLKALPERERLLNGVRDQVKRHRAKQTAQVVQVVERTRLAGAGGTVAVMTLPMTPAGAHGPERWRPVADVGDEGGLQTRMFVLRRPLYLTTKQTRCL